MNITDENGQEIDFEDFTLPPKPSYSYAYCSDTAYWETVIPFIQNDSVFVIEAAGNAVRKVTLEQFSKNTQNTMLIGRVKSKYKKVATT